MDALCYPLTVNDDRGRHAGRGRQPDRGRRPRLRPGRTARTRPTATRRRTTRRSTTRSSSTSPGTTMKDPNRWQPLQLEQMISQNGIPVENGVQQAVGPHWGHVLGFGIPDGGRAGVPIDPGPPPLLGGPGARTRRTRTRPSRSSGDSSLLDAASDETIDISPGVRRRQHAGHERRHGPPGQPGDRPAVRAGRRQGGRLRPRADRVLGGRAEVRDAARPLERHRQRGVATSSDPNLKIGGHGRRGRPAAVGREAVPRAQRRGPRRGDRRLGPQGPLRLRPPDLDDPLHGRASASRATRRCRRTTRRASRSCPDLVELITPETTAAGQRHAALAGHEGEIAIRAWAGNPRTRRPRRAASPGSSPSTGCRTSCRRS